jgi:leader peptidase (prepilin peptidase) / N-methyltransferase
MSIVLPLVSGLTGGAAGSVVSWIVDRATRNQTRSTRKIELFLAVAASAILLAALAIRLNEPGIRLFVYGALMVTLVGVTIFDLRTQTIPHVVTIPGMILGLITGSFLLPLGIRQSMLGLLVGGGVLLLATFMEAVRKKEIGGGDWKYAAMIGSVIGPKSIIIALVLTGVFGAIGGIALTLAGTHARPHALGPWLSAGAAASILLG